MLQQHKKAYTVSEITNIVKMALQSLTDIWVEGEISNISRPTSGHIYFTLKDRLSQIRGVIFRSDLMYMRYVPKNGDKVFLHGRIDVYTRGGYHQIIGDAIEPAGLGALQIALERLKQRLAAEGYFAAEHKKPLPKIPQRIGVITSSTGAAVRDIINIITRRFPNVYILVYPVLVQGEGAADEIARAIDEMNEIGGFDVLIIGRGGGSIEDLWAFNEEVVARSVYASEIPIISAVGHEIDYTISDFVADVRAPTPSAAAELVVPDKTELIRRISNARSRIQANIQRKLQAVSERFANCQRQLSPQIRLDAIRQQQQTVDSLNLQIQRAFARMMERWQNDLGKNTQQLLHLSPLPKIVELQRHLKGLNQQCVNQMQSILRKKDADWKAIVAKLDALNPLSILARGYSICYDHEQKIIKDSRQVEAGDQIQVKLAHGKLTCDVVCSDESAKLG
ncbi:MAG: exodeoxyribonuclease VII large subunit [Candidatus Poribacteria bacterium]